MANSKITLSVIHEQLKYIKEKTESIEKHAKETNGKVAEAHIKIAKMQTLQENCPARNNYNNDKKDYGEWVKWGIVAMISTANIVLLYVK
jgi:hypothetical protein